MEKFKCWILVTLCVVLCVSCTKVEDTEVLVSKEKNPFFIPLDSAIAISNRAVRAICEGEQTRSSNIIREVDDAKLVSLSSRQTRAADVNELSTSLYVVNYKDNNGFAIVSSDRRLRPLYAVSDTGHFEFTDTLKNMGLSLFVKGVENDMMKSVHGDSVSVQASSSSLDNLTVLVRPKIWRGPRLWSQDAPYNTYCFTKDKKNAKVGCAAVACGIIMTYYEWPWFVDSVRIGWHGMKKYTFDHDIDYVFGKLGHPKLLNMQYGEYASSAPIGNVPRTFERFGYDRPNDVDYFTESAVCKYLRTNGPVLVGGNNKATGAGHIWVIDGYSTDQINSSGEVVGSILFHCIWGWNGYNNGYFFLNDGIIGDNSYGYDNEDKVSVEKNAYWKLKYVAGFKKNSEKQSINTDEL